MLPTIGLAHRSWMGRCTPVRALDRPQLLHGTLRGDAITRSRCRADCAMRAAGEPFFWHRICVDARRALSDSLPDVNDGRPKSRDRNASPSYAPCHVSARRRMSVRSHVTRNRPIAGCSTDTGGARQKRTHPIRAIVTLAAPLLAFLAFHDPAAASSLLEMFSRERRSERIGWAGPFAPVVIGADRIAAVVASPIPGAPVALPSRSRPVLPPRAMSRARSMSSSVPMPTPSPPSQLYDGWAGMRCADGLATALRRACSVCRMP